MWYKDPEDTLDYRFSWWKWLSKGDKVATTSITIELDVGGTGSATVADYNFTRNDVTVLVSGGVSGEVYNISCSIETEYGLIETSTRPLTIN